MKLKNTLGLAISSMFNVRVDYPVIELRRGDNGYPVSWLLLVVVAGWEIHRIPLNHMEGSEMMLSMKHHPRGLQADCDAVNASSREAKLLRTDVDSWIWDLPYSQQNSHLGNLTVSSGHSSLTAMCRPRNHQLPVIANVGTIGHGIRREAFSAVSAFTGRKVMVSLEQDSESAVQRLHELALKHEYRYTPPPAGESPKKYYFDPSAGLNPHLEG